MFALCTRLSRGKRVRVEPPVGSDGVLGGIHEMPLMRALKLLEGQGKVTIFTGSTPEDIGVKFL